MSDEELDALIGKVQRFKTILTRLQARDAVRVWGPRPVPRAIAAA